MNISNDESGKVDLVVKINLKSSDIIPQTELMENAKESTSPRRSQRRAKRKIDYFESHDDFSDENESFNHRDYPMCQEGSSSDQASDFEYYKILSV